MRTAHKRQQTPSPLKLRLSLLLRELIIARGAPPGLRPDGGNKWRMLGAPAGLLVHDLSLAKQHARRSDAAVLKARFFFRGTCQNCEGGDASRSPPFVEAMTPFHTTNAGIDLFVSEMLQKRRSMLHRNGPFSMESVIARGGSSSNACVHERKVQIERRLWP